MKPQVKTFISLIASAAISLNIVSAQESQGNETLENTLHRAVCERIDGPIVFATRDTAFALSLPTDEPATLYLQLTVGRNGKVKDKQTKVHANHLAESIAPTFKAATEKLRVDRSLLGGMTGKDTALVVAFPIKYCHVFDTTTRGSRAHAHPYRHFNSEDYMRTYFYGTRNNSLHIWRTLGFIPPRFSFSSFPQPTSASGHLSFYIALIQESEK